ncbi:MAG: NAD-dependent epimerase/dehydratase family protein [Gammaproteobacteria bacterium]|nr:NAD-dependent epimerase/dehydratase family protein [Gammaproteobacteria bacterium]MDE0365652.1 NAD-dependent epimerase/dehydratase family protein [Gammaproteobacteria bacterium]
MDRKISEPRHPVLVTGSSGHVGANLVRRLLDDGVRVRVLSRRESGNEALDGLDVERAHADIRDLDATRRALEGCAGVYHCAAMVSTIDGNRAHRRELFECNVLGTRNVLQAARETGAGRVVVTGSFSAVGYDLDDPSAPSDESMPFYPMERTMPYERSKVLVEHECLRAAAIGQDVVIATCCAVVGGADYLPSRLGRTLCDYANGKLHAYVDGGFAFVAARDIVAGHLLCMRHGRSGEKYIFASEYKTISDILDLYEEATGIPRPHRRIPAPIMYAFSEVASFYLSRFHPNFPQRFTPGAIRLLKMRRRANIDKARQELGYRPTSIRAAVREAYAFHYGRNAIRNPDARPPSPVPAASPPGPAADEAARPMADRPA